VPHLAPLRAIAAPRPPVNLTRHPVPLTRASASPRLHRRSNLRIATTAAPISASDAQADHVSTPTEVMVQVRKMPDYMRGFVTFF
jgi:hypothetical protein